MVTIDEIKMLRTEEEYKKIQKNFKPVEKLIKYVEKFLKTWYENSHNG